MRIGRLIPWIIALGLALDATTRLIPIDMFSFRAWEALLVARGPTGPFEPNRVYVNPLTHGDLSRARRYGDLRQHHLEYFSTDEWGFRNTVPEYRDRPVDWLLVGDSYGVSSGVRDGNTLASQLAQWSGERVYNASSYDPPLPLADIRFTSERLGMQGGLVIYEYMERQQLPTDAAFHAFRVFANGPPPPKRSLSERYRVWRKDAAVDRLTILAGWGWDSIATKIGANPSDANSQAAGELPTASYRLANGQTMLFFTGDIVATQDPNRQISPDYLIWLNAELAKLNLRLVVLLVPNKYSVYAPLVNDPAAVRPSELPLRRLADNLEARDVFVVNVSDALRKQAADDLPLNEYVYFVDDTHWNERGIAVAAQALVEAWNAR
jgi:hypothetical protein